MKKKGMFITALIETLNTFKIQLYNCIGIGKILLKKILLNVKLIMIRVILPNDLRIIVQPVNDDSNLGKVARKYCWDLKKHILLFMKTKK